MGFVGILGTPPKASPHRCQSQDMSTEVDHAGTTASVRELLDFATAQRLLGVSRATFFRLVADGELPVVKLRARSLIRPDDLEALIARNVRQRPTPKRAA
jgi:excisionase family DNA binding protein